MVATAQQKSLALVPKFTGALSLIGSLFILQDILRDKKKRTKSVYHKVMIGLSTFDVMSSIANIFSTWPSPADQAASIYLASGTTATCTAQGFFNELGNITTPLYTVALCMRYLLVVRYNWKESRLEKYEKLFHVVPVSIGFLMAILGLPFQLYNNSGWICWYAPYPQGCMVDNTCTRGGQAGTFRWIHYGIIWSAILFVTAGMILIYIQVRDQEKKASFFRDASTPSEQPDGSMAGAVRRLSRRLSFTSRIESPAQQRARKRMAKSKKVAAQAFLYVGALYLTWGFTTLTRIFQTARNETHFPLLMLMAIFFPLQGFFNCIIYVRPRYLRERHKRATFAAVQAVRVSVLSGLEEGKSQEEEAEEESLSELTERKEPAQYFAPLPENVETLSEQIERKDFEESFAVPSSAVSAVTSSATSSGLPLRGHPRQPSSRRSLSSGSSMTSRGY